MIANFNDLLRKKVTDEFNFDIKSQELGIVDFFYSLKEEQQITLLKLALADFYKISYYTNNKPHAIFNINIEDTINYCIVDVGSAIDVLKSIKSFNDMDYVSKCLILEMLESQDNIITSIYKFHNLDKLTYQIIDDIELYKEYYINYLEINKENPNRIKIISDFISYRFLELKKIDYIKYQKYILECIKVYYKWKNFIKDHEGKYLLNKIDFKYLEIIENLSLTELLEKVNSSFNLLFTLVSEYLHYTTSKLEIKEEIVDNYFMTKTDTKIREKLKI